MRPRRRSARPSGPDASSLRGAGSTAYAAPATRVDLRPGFSFSLADPGPTWRPLADCPSLIVVGLTGVGKTTLLRGLVHTRVEATLLPDRREMTDALVIAPQRASGVPPDRLPRLARYAFVEAFRQAHPHGMAWLLDHCWVDPTVLPTPLVFDGLRGAAEVGHAARSLPRAAFLVLECPESIRLERLLSRADPHDRPLGIVSRSSDREVGSVELPAAIRARLRRGEIGAADLETKLEILATERRLYPPGETKLALADLDSSRTLTLDATAPSDQLVGRAAAWWPFPADRRRPEG